MISEEPLDRGLDFAEFVERPGGFLDGVEQDREACRLLGEVAELGDMSWWPKVSEYAGQFVQDFDAVIAAALGLGRRSEGSAILSSLMQPMIAHPMGGRAEPARATSGLDLEYGATQQAEHFVTPGPEFRYRRRSMPALRGSWELNPLACSLIAA